MDARGYIYLGKYSGWYCTSDEAFLTDIELDEIKNASGKTIKVSKESGHPVEWTEEDNYKFRLSTLQDELKYWIKRGIKLHTTNYEDCNFILKSIFFFFLQYRNYCATCKIS